MDSARPPCAEASLARRHREPFIAVVSTLIDPVATLSVDLDPVDRHLLGYGHDASDPDPSVYEVALPRLLGLLAREEIPATFFVVARDARTQKDACRAILDAGHEIASHSMTHPVGLTRLPREALWEELSGSRRELEQATGQGIRGFRAPNFDLDERVVETLIEAGYDYDASGYPTPLLLPARLVLARKSRKPRPVLAMTRLPLSYDRAPHAFDRLVEFPVSVSPWIRMPLYHTLRYGMRADRFERALDGFHRRRESLSYLVHAIDAMGLAEDRIDARLATHPGMGHPLAVKMGLLSATLRAIGSRFRMQRFSDRLADCASGRLADPAQSRLTGAAHDPVSSAPIPT